MPSFSLTLEIDPQSLQTLLEVGENVVVVKAPGGSTSQVVWVALSPFENNQVVWTSDYALGCNRTCPPATPSRSRHPSAQGPSSRGA
jgi:hypothetical protein